MYKIPPMQPPPPSADPVPQFNARDGDTVVPIPCIYNPVMGTGLVVPLAYICEEMREEVAKVRVLKKEVEELEKKNNRLEEGIVDCEKHKTNQDRLHTRYLEHLRKSHAGEVKMLNSEVTELKAQIVDAKNELTSMNPIIDAHVEQKTRLLEENDRILHENQNLFEENKRMVEENQRLLGENKGLLEEDAKNKQMLAGWKIQREVLTHIMAGTMPVDHAELSKARKSVSAYMNPAALQTELKKICSDVQPEEEVPQTLAEQVPRKKHKNFFGSEVPREKAVPRTTFRPGAQGGIDHGQEAPRKVLPPMKRSWPEVSDEAMKASKKK